MFSCHTEKLITTHASGFLCDTSRQPPKADYSTVRKAGSFEGTLPCCLFARPAIPSSRPSRHGSGTLLDQAADSVDPVPAKALADSYRRHRYTTVNDRHGRLMGPHRLTESSLRWMPSTETPRSGRPVVSCMKCCLCTTRKCRLLKSYRTFSMLSRAIST